MAYAEGWRYVRPVPRLEEVNMGTSDIVNHMRAGATLHRGFGDKIELRIPSMGVVFVPPEILDSLIEQNQIALTEGGLYKPKI